MDDKVIECSLSIVEIGGKNFFEYADSSGTQHRFEEFDAADAISEYGGRRQFVGLIAMRDGKEFDRADISRYASESDWHCLHGFEEIKSAATKRDPAFTCEEFSPVVKAAWFAPGDRLRFFGSGGSKLHSLMPREKAQAA